MSEPTGYAVVKGRDGQKDTDEEIVAVYPDEDVAVHNSFFLFRPDIRERVKEQDPREERVQAFPNTDGGIYVRVEETVLKGGLVKDVTVELKR